MKKVVQMSLNEGLKRLKEPDDKPMMCPVVGCNKLMINRYKLNRHLIETKAHLELEFDPKFKFKCNLCSFRCDQQNWIPRHMKALHSVQSIQCEVCHKFYKNPKILDIHMRSHTDWTIKCTVDGCEAVFKNFNTRFDSIV